MVLPEVPAAEHF